MINLFLLGATLISGLVTIVSLFVQSFYLNKKIGEQKVELDKTLEDYKVRLDEKRKISALFYEKRAEALISLHASLCDHYSDLLNMLSLLVRLQSEVFSSPDGIEKVYQEMRTSSKTLRKALLSIGLYLEDEEADLIHFFQHELAECSNAVVDAYTDYQILDKKFLHRMKRDEEASDFNSYFSKVLSGYEIEKYFDKMNEKGQQKIIEIKKIIKETLKSE